MFTLAYVFIGFFVIYDALFCCAMGYTAIVEEWCCQNPFPALRERLTMQFRIKYHRLFNKDPLDENEDIIDVEI